MMKQCKERDAQIKRHYWNHETPTPKPTERCQCGDVTWEDMKAKGGQTPPGYRTP